MKKKGFVLMETIIVIVVISVALLTIFASYNKILTKVKKENKYDTSEYIYMTNYVKKFLNGKINKNNAFSMKSINGIPTNYLESYDDLIQFNVKGVYLLKDLNSTQNDIIKKFNANMIDYIRKLDVGDNDILLVVEYDRVALDDKGNPIYTTSCPEGGKDSNNFDCKPLTETYIASLEWE